MRKGRAKGDGGFRQDDGSITSTFESLEAARLLSALMATGLEVEEALDSIAEGNPELAQTCLMEWGKDRWVESLDLSWRDWVLQLPENMNVIEMVDVAGCVNLASLPRRMEVGLFLDLQGCTAWDRILPPGLNIPGAVVFTDEGTFGGPFTPAGCVVTSRGLFGLPLS